MSDYWNDQADQLAKELSNHVPALIEHFVRTATPEALAALGGSVLPAEGPQRTAVVEKLRTRVLLEDASVTA